MLNQEKAKYTKDAVLRETKTLLNITIFIFITLMAKKNIQYYL